MILKNKLGIKSEIELAQVEEQISKLKAKKLFESGFLDTLEAEFCAIIYKFQKRINCAYHDIELRR